MESYNVEDLKKDIRIALDRNNSNVTLSNLGDIETLTINEIIASKIIPAATYVFQNAAIRLFDDGATSEVEASNGRVTLPDDFLRLLAFKMTDWSRTLSVAITENDPKYNIQHSSYGVKGNVERPVIALVRGSGSMVLEYFSSTGSVEVFQYVPVPSITGTGNDATIDISPNLYEAVVTYAAYLVAVTTGDKELASTLLAATAELIK